MLLLILIIPKASGIDHNNSAGPLRYEVSASAASMVADQPDHAPNKAETCAVLQRRYTGRETRAIRAKRQQALAELKLLETDSVSMPA